MNVRFEPHGDDHEELCSLLALVNDDQGFPDYLVRVRRRDGRQVFGPYATVNNEVFGVTNPWPPHAAREHGWKRGEKGILVEPRDVEWLEYVSETSPDFVAFEADDEGDANEEGRDEDGPEIDEEVAAGEDDEEEDGGDGASERAPSRSGAATGARQEAADAAGPAAAVPPPRRDEGRVRRGRPSRRRIL